MRVHELTKESVHRSLVSDGWADDAATLLASRFRDELNADVIAKLVGVIDGRKYAVPTVKGARRRLHTDHRKAIFERDGFRCKHCGTPDDLTVDHIIPVTAGGLSFDENLQTLCRSCNSKKGCRIDQ